MMLATISIKLLKDSVAALLFFFVILFFCGSALASRTKESHDDARHQESLDEISTT
jgi:hypothetical protein